MVVGVTTEIHDDGDIALHTPIARRADVIQRHDFQHQMVKTDHAGNTDKGQPMVTRIAVHEARRQTTRGGNTIRETQTQRVAEKALGTRLVRHQQYRVA